MMFKNRADKITCACFSEKGTQRLGCEQIASDNYLNSHQYQQGSLFMQCVRTKFLIMITITGACVKA